MIFSYFTFLIELLVLVYCVYFVSYSLIFAIGGYFYKPSQSSNNTSLTRFLVLVPGYKEDAVIVSATKQNLQQTYPSDKYDLMVIADSFSPNTIKELKQLPVKVFEVSFDKSTKVKALKEAVSRMDHSYDYVVILDADNVMENDYLEKVNRCIANCQYEAIQTERAPKNDNNSLAVLDGISEAINNHIYRQGSHAMGMSVALSGSGMVFKAPLFRDTIMTMESVGGFDRELEYRLIEQGTKVKYYREARVFDEKTDDKQNFSNQRKRWISSQYIYLRKYFFRGVRALLRGNVVYFHSTVWRNIQLPRLINLGLITMIAFAAILLHNFIHFSLFLWLLLWFLNATSMLIAIPRRFYSVKMLRSLILLPGVFYSMLLLVFKLKGANSKFIHTQHKSA